MSLTVKELLLAKKALPFIFIMMIVFPAFLTKQIGEDMSMIVFYLIMIVIMLMLPGTISMNESKYEKAYAYLSTTPYSRRQLVLCKYILDLIVFLTITFIYSIEALVVPEFVKEVEFIVIGITFISVCLLRGLVIPLEFKFGYEKTKYISTIIIMVFCFGVPLLIKNIGLDFAESSFLKFFLELPRAVLNTVLFVGGVVISAMSFELSYIVFKNKEI